MKGEIELAQFIIGLLPSEKDGQMAIAITGGLTMLGETLTKGDPNFKDMMTDITKAVATVVREAKFGGSKISELATGEGITSNPELRKFFEDSGTRVVDETAKLLAPEKGGMH